jgi:hypothetical protein
VGPRIWNVVRNLRSVMAARSLEADPSGFPIRSGMVGVSGAVLRGTPETDACGLVVDEEGSVCVFVVKVTGAAARPDMPALAAAAVGVAAKARLPIYELLGDLRRFAASESANLGLSLLRITARDSRVEILNAGMPAIVRLLPGEAPTVYQSRSGPVGNRFAEVHAYELTSLVWGSAWLLTSDGVTAGSLDPVILLRGIAGSGLTQSAHELVDAQIARVEGATLALSAACGETAGDDRTLVVVSADPRRRFESGIESRG